MVERKQFKTRLCVLYQRGRCARQNCSFAHGNAELRRFSASFTGRRDYLGNDLRDKLERRHLSPRRYSPARVTRGRKTIRDYSPSRSLEKKSDRKRRRKQGFTGQGDTSGSLKVSDRIQDRVKEGKLLSSGSKNTLEEQLKKLQSDINILEQRKFQLGVYLDESVQEVDSFNSRIQELETQLCKENEECQRITSKIRKFIKVHNHNTKLQDELKRSQVQLQRLGEQLVLDITRIGANEEDLSIDIVSNGETTGLPLNIKHNAEQNDASSHRKRLRIERDAFEVSKQDRSKVGHLIETTRPRKWSRWNVAAQLNDDEGREGLEASNHGTKITRPLDLEGKHKKGILSHSNHLCSEKLKESRIEVPSTSMAAHVIDEEVEIELEDRTNIGEIARSQNENGVAFEAKGLPLMLPASPTPHSNCAKCEGDDDKVDVDGLDEEVVTTHVDIV